VFMKALNARVKLRCGALHHIGEDPCRKITSRRRRESYLECDQTRGKWMSGQEFVQTFIAQEPSYFRPPDGSTVDVTARSVSIEPGGQLDGR